MAFEIKVKEDVARQEIEQLLEKKLIFPERIIQIEKAIEEVVTGVKYGFIVINDDETIVQTLMRPCDTVTELKYKPFVSPTEVNTALKNMTKETFKNTCLAYIKCYTGQTEAKINQLHPADRNLAECISLFFQ